jgi:hypothetical protein
MDVEKEKFRRRFPNLASEVDEESTGIHTDSTIAEELNGEASIALPREPVKKKLIRSFDGYDPNAIDFIRRCGSEKEAQEIIEYLERTGEIGRSEAQRMRVQLRSKGLRSFGAKKEYGYYMKSINE